MLPEISPTLIRRRLTFLFPEELIEGIARERDAVQRHRKIDITMLVWSLILGFAAFQRAYQTATNQKVSRSSFYDRFTPEFHNLLSDLLAHALEEIAPPHTIVPQLTQFRDTMLADATVFRLHRLLTAFPATHEEQSGAQLFLVYNMTRRTLSRFSLTDERTHENSQFRTGNWLRGRLFLFDLGFYSYRRFALIDENDGYFVSRLKTNANPRSSVRDGNGAAAPFP